MVNCFLVFWIVVFVRFTLSAEDTAEIYSNIDCKNLQDDNCPVLISNSIPGWVDSESPTVVPSSASKPLKRHDAEAKLVSLNRHDFRQFLDALWFHALDLQEFRFIIETSDINTQMLPLKIKLLVEKTNKIENILWLRRNNSAGDGVFNREHRSLFFRHAKLFLEGVFSKLLGRYSDEILSEYSDYESIMSILRNIYPIGPRTIDERRRSIVNFNQSYVSFNWEKCLKYLAEYLEKYRPDHLQYQTRRNLTVTYLKSAESLAIESLDILHGNLLDIWCFLYCQKFNRLYTFSSWRLSEKMDTFIMTKNGKSWMRAFVDPTMDSKEIKIFCGPTAMPTLTQYFSLVRGSNEFYFEDKLDEKYDLMRFIPYELVRRFLYPELLPFFKKKLCIFTLREGHLVPCDYEHLLLDDEVFCKYEQVYSSETGKCQYIKYLEILQVAMEKAKRTINLDPTFQLRVQRTSGILFAIRRYFHELLSDIELYETSFEAWFEEWIDFMEIVPLDAEISSLELWYASLLISLQLIK